MIRKLVPVLLVVIGLAAGIGAGLYLRPAAAPTDDEKEGTSPGRGSAQHEKADIDGEDVPDYVKLSNQFVVPVVEKGRVAAMVVLSLTLEVAPGNTEAVYSREPKLRDAFLQVLFDHANVGGFSGSFTDGSNLIVLRNSLREAANMVLGELASDVLITDIARQDS